MENLLLLPLRVVTQRAITIERAIKNRSKNIIRLFSIATHMPSRRSKPLCLIFLYFAFYIVIALNGCSSFLLLKVIPNKNNRKLITIAIKSEKEI